MTKLMQWLSVLLPVGCAWSLATYNIVKEDGMAAVVKTTLLNQFILASPFIFLVVFAGYAATVVIYRTLTFNDCNEAAKELQEEIIEAKKFMISKGIIEEEAKDK